ncbi:phasin family protein [Roseospira visakhapatnamensis]|uniref:Phasin family protein n=1 Tax=Roseospira visakhapatnamensis TaxID=390880 RepID=A0A7W6RDN9_9PROT|nr:phasin family protein [Roseospira visakhapatnamensis]MBB4265963.1 phasin family protein [Roseospira visakhapatnamensis]
MIKTVDDLMAFNRANVEAVTTANQVLAQGFKSLSEESLTFSSRTMEETVAVTKKMSTCKTPTDITSLQSKLVKDNWEALVAQTKKMTEMSTAVVKDALDPLNARYKAVVDGMMRVAS